jgi:hypothetical protein
MTSTAADGAAAFATPSGGEDAAAIRTFNLHGSIKSSTPAHEM